MKGPFVAPPLRLISERASVKPQVANGEKKSWMPNCEFVNWDRPGTRDYVPLVPDVQIIHHVIGQNRW